MKKMITLLQLSFLLAMGNAIVAQNTVRVDENTFGDVVARQIGPATMSGRISALDAVDKNPALLYAGAASGGLWKSKNYGTTFKPVFDKYCQSIGAITIDQKHPDTVWVGTGEVWVRNSTSVGDGIYRTRDGGDNWQKLGLEKTERIGRIIIDPRNSEVVYAAALGNLWNPSSDRGLYKTTDGGKTWEKILYVDENTGCSDVAIDWKDPDIIYAGMWEFRRTPWSFSSGGKGSGLYRSADGGKTWTKITKNLPEGIFGRVSLAVSAIKAETVYALIEAKKTGLYRSIDKGLTWQMMTQSEAINDRPFYFSCIALDPLDSNIIYKPGFNLFKSVDGGRTFSSAAVEGGNYHSDCHTLYISKKDNNLIYMGTDGGIYVSMDKGNTWRFLRNLPVSQFYHVSTDNAIPYNVYGGLQDNGSWYAPSESASGVTNCDWKSVGFGDGFYVYADKIDSSILYWQFQGGHVARYYKKTGEYKSLIPFKDNNTKDLRFNWNTPLVFSPARNNFYLGAQYLYKSNNRGDTWVRISPDLTTDNPNEEKQEQSGGLTIDNSSAENHCTIYTINESPLDSNIVWAGTDDGNLQVTTDGGKSWTNVVKNIQGLPAETWCTYVEPGFYDKNTVFVTFDGHRTGDKHPYIFTSNDLGKTWTSLYDTTIKNYCQVIRQDIVNSAVLYLGTEGGLYISVDGGRNWAHFTGKVPNVPIMDIAFQARERSLILASHGRGIMIIDDLTPIRQIRPDLLESDVRFLKTKDYIFKEGQQSQMWNGDDEFVGQSSVGAANIDYYLRKRHIFGDMEIRIFDKDGNLVQKLPASNRKGINIVRWSVRMKPPKVPSSPQMEGSAMTGPNVAPGEYTVKLIKGKDEFETKIRLLPDPNSQYSLKDREVRQTALMQAYNLLETLAYTDRQVKDIMYGARDRSKSTPKSLSKKLKQVADRMDTLHGKIVSTKEGKVTGEERLREKIAFIYGGILSYLGKPTDSQLEALTGFVRQVTDINDNLGKLESVELAKINKELTRVNLKEIKVISQEEFKKEP